MDIRELRYKNYRWLNLKNPESEEIDYLKEEFPFHPLNLEDYQTKTQSPKLDLYRHYTLFVFDLPYFAPGGQQILVSEIDFFLGEDYLVVLHDDKLPLINEVFHRCQDNKKTLQRFLSKGPIFLFYRLSDLLIDSAFPILDKLSAETEQIDREILEGGRTNIVAGISLQRRNIILFQTMIKPTLPIFEKLEKGEIERLNGGMTNYWSNLLDHSQKIWERLEDLREINEGLSSAYESLIGYRTNEIVKFLTVITSISFPFIIVNNLYSMNITGLPYANSPYIVPALFGLIFLTGVGVIAYFRLRRWL